MTASSYHFEHFGTVCHTAHVADTAALGDTSGGLGRTACSRGNVIHAEDKSAGCTRRGRPSLAAFLPAPGTRSHHPLPGTGRTWGPQNRKDTFTKRLGGFLGLGTAGIWAGKSSVAGAYPVQWRVFGGLPGPRPRCDKQKCLQALTTRPLGSKNIAPGRKPLCDRIPEQGQPSERTLAN